MIGLIRPGQTSVQFYLCDTLWEFDDFCIAQNLREIDFGDSLSVKSTTLTHLETLNFDFLNFCTF